MGNKKPVLKKKKPETSSGTDSTDELYEEEESELEMQARRAMKELEEADPSNTLCIEWEDRGPIW